MRKKLLSLALALVMYLGLAVPALAYDTGKPGENNSVTMLGTHASVLDADGVLWAWGCNDYGAVGNNSLEDVNTPVKIQSDVASVSAGGDFTAAVKKDGTLWWCGDGAFIWPVDRYGELEYPSGRFGPFRGSQTPRLYPKQLMDHVAAISCGNSHIAVIKTDGTLWVWGHGAWGQIGQGTRDNQDTPVKVMDQVVAVACGKSHTAAIKADGSLWLWGKNEFGQIGNGKREKEQTTPVKVMDNVAHVSCGGEHTAVIKTDGTVWAWGDNTYGQLGNGGQGNDSHTAYADIGGGSTTYVYQTVPIQIAEQAADVVCGSGITAIIKSDNSLWTCGDNTNGALGLGYRSNSPVKNFQKALDDVVTMRCNGASSVALRTDGTVYSWGKNAYGILGNGDIWDTTYEYRHSTYYCLVQPTLIAGIRGNVSNASPGSSAATGFWDVSAADYFATPVAWAVKREITQGTGGNQFSPGQNCTNAQILTFLWHAYGEPEPTIGNPFTNSIPDAYAKAAIWAYERGMVSGTAFDVDTPCTRAMAVTYMWQAAGSPMPFASVNSFTDVSADAPYALAVAWALEKGITTGTSATTFSPADICNRGQIVTFLHRNLA